MQTTAISIDAMLSTLNATDVGTLDSIAEKLRQVREQLEALGQPDLAQRADDAIRSLADGDIVEFKRARAYLQSKIGHLRR
jgi:CRP-like cAMP-binding protein